MLLIETIAPLLQIGRLPVLFPSALAYALTCTVPRGGHAYMPLVFETWFLPFCRRHHFRKQIFEQSAEGLRVYYGERVSGTGIGIETNRVR